MMQLATDRGSAYLPADGARDHLAPPQAALAHGLEDDLAVVAHDLKTPLAAIALRCERMQRNLTRGPANPIQLAQDFADDIGRYAGRMQELVHSILDTVKKPGDPFGLYREPTSVAALMDRAQRMWAPLAQARGVRLVSRTDRNLGLLLCDASRMHQVFSNLADNALKFSRAGQCITLEARARADHLQFSVSDEGPGIAEEHVAHLFGRLWQGPGASHRGGTGLGLYIARRIVEAHGGAIEVLTRTEAPSGTTFRFVLPRHLPAA